MSDQDSTTSSDQSSDVANGNYHQQQQLGDRSALLSAINSFSKTSLRPAKSVDGAVPSQDIDS